MAASYTDKNYCGTSASYGTTKCKWKPRKVSAKRDFPAAFKEQKVIEARKDSAGEGVTDFTRIVTETRDLDMGDGDKNSKLDAYDITPRVFNNKTRGLDNIDGDQIAELSNCGIIPCTVGTETRGSDTDDGDGGRDEVAKLGLNTELMVRGVSLKAIKWCQTEDGLKIDLSKLPKGDFASYKQRRVSAVRDFPPGCGPASVCS